MDDHEAAAALGVGVDELALLGLEVAADLTVDDRHVGLRELGRGERSTAPHRGELHAGPRRARARLVEGQVRVLAEEHLFTALRVALQRDLVPHRPARNEDRRLFPGDRGDLRFEPIHRGIFAVDVVADLRAGHGLAHSGGGPGDGVGPEIEESHRPRL